MVVRGQTCCVRPFSTKFGRSENRTKYGGQSKKKNVLRRTFVFQRNRSRVWSRIFVTVNTLVVAGCFCFFVKSKTGSAQKRRIIRNRKKTIRPCTSLGTFETNAKRAVFELPCWGGRLGRTDQVEYSVCRPKIRERVENERNTRNESYNPRTAKLTRGRISTLLFPDPCNALARVRTVNIYRF